MAWAGRAGAFDVARTGTRNMRIFGSGTLVLHQRCNVLDELLGKANPGDDLRFLENDEVDVVAFLSPFKQVVINSSHIFGHFARFDVVLVEKAANSGMLLRGQAILNEKG